MKPVHRLIICGNPDKWFTWVDKAKGNSGGGIYEINMGAKCLQGDSLSSNCQAAVQNALFILEKAGKNVEKYYLAIIDRDSLGDINKYRWHLPIGRNYWSTGYFLYLNKLHKFVVYLSGQAVNGDDIHHDNFYTFDNRKKNLPVLSKSAHQLRHLDQNGKKVKIEDFKPITNDTEFLDFITSVF